MSYTQFVATATLIVADGFKLESYLDEISERSVKEENFLFKEYGEIDGKIDIDLSSYVRQNDDTILIECDTEEYNGNSEVWDWLIDQFLPIMESKYAQIKSASIDSRSGVDVDFCLYSKEGKAVSLDDILKKYNDVTL